MAKTASTDTDLIFQFCLPNHRRSQYILQIQRVNVNVQHHYAQPLQLLYYLILVNKLMSTCFTWITDEAASCCMAPQKCKKMQKNLRWMCEIEISADKNAFRICYL